MSIEISLNLDSDKKCLEPLKDFELGELYYVLSYLILSHVFPKVKEFKSVDFLLGVTCNL